ncbi:ankyrin repeat and SOCS box protein 16 [Ambystoma mexicanum]|uniref:ankyrin repeat and SOCS box protein 16 n=1 Tax=Ambystoma mexicanum TaxID=8296 RepID=UPI0037E8A438
MAGKETFPFTSSTLRALRLQEERLDWEDRRRALARRCLARRPLATPRAPSQARKTLHCRDPTVHNALYTGDAPSIRGIFQDATAANMVVELVSEELLWSAEIGLWSLTPKMKQMSPLRIVASRGYVDCVKHILQQGADINALIGGSCALHDACVNHRPECAQLLLNYGANPNVMSEEGSAPLHLCSTPGSFQCAQLLLEYGARVNLKTRDCEVTPLHVAAKQGLEEHITLYLCNGADITLQNREGETALNAACAGADKPEQYGRYYRVVNKLLYGGADARVAGRKSHTPLHNACGNCHHRIVELLLQHGAEVNAVNCAGYTPLDCILQVVEDYTDCQPERIVRTLLNHGATPSNPKMWRYCASSPETLEVLLNCYDRIPTCDTWMETVSSEIWQDHQIFYDSVLKMTNRPRRLQHLARCALRRHLGGGQALAQLELPSSMKEYLLLQREGYLQ